MRTSTLVLLGVLFTANVLRADPARAQNASDKLISIDVTDISFAELFKMIESKTGVMVMYENTSNLLNNTVTIAVDKVSVGDLLTRVLDGKPFKWISRKDIIRIEEASEDAARKIAGLSPRLDIDLPPITVRGRVVNEKGEPVVASIIVKGTNKGTATDNYGNFVLENISDGSVLVITGISIESQEIRIDGRQNLNITALTKILSEEEIVVNKGYYSENKRLSTGNVSKLNAKEIEKQPVSNPLATLQGRIPGLDITQQTGVPGGNFKVNIRGLNSIANGNDPLYIIDGVPFVSNTLSSTQTTGELYVSGTSPFNTINPSDIASIEVLKDADATSIYGSRGANGVILITTKKGRSGKSKVELNFYSGIGKAARKIDLLNTEQYLEMRKEAFQNDNITPSNNTAPDLLLWDQSRYTDWQKVLIGGTAQSTDGQLTFSGGDANTQFLANGGYHRESSVFPGKNSDYRISTHLNITHQSANQKFKSTFSINYSAGSSNLPQRDFTSAALTLSPNSPPIYKENGNLNWENSTWTNPFSFLRRTYSAKTNTFIGNAVLSYLLTKNLELKTSVGYTRTAVGAMALTPGSSYNPALASIVQNQTTFSNSDFQNWIVEPQLTWNKKFGNSKLTVLIGSTVLAQETESNALIGKGFASEALMKNISSAAKVENLTGGSYAQYKYNAGFARINYMFKEKYLLNLTGRRDGSSRFGPGKQFSNFGAVGAGWIFSEEEFIRNNIFLSFGKVKISYGTTGNDQLGDYVFMDTYMSSSGTYYGNVGLTPARLNNPLFAWETNKKFEAGTDLGFMNDRVFLSVNYYRNRSSNQLIGFPLSPTTGFATIAGNFPATVQNSGFEFELSLNNIRSKDFSWNTSFNLTAPKNKIASFPDIEAFPSYANTYVVGEPMTIRKLYYYDGIDPTTGLYKFRDVDTSGTLGIDDRQAVKNVGKKFYGGVNNIISYKGFELSVLFQFAKQTGHNYLSGGWDIAPGGLMNQPTEVLDRWQKAGDNTNIQRFTTNSSIYSNVRNSELSVSDASYIRLKNVALSYTFKKQLLTRIKVSGLKFFVLGQNLFTITNYKGLDPESQSSAYLPPMRFITGGFNIIL